MSHCRGSCLGRIKVRGAKPWEIRSDCPDLLILSVLNTQLDWAVCVMHFTTLVSLRHFYSMNISSTSKLTSLFFPFVSTLRPHHKVHSILLSRYSLCSAVIEMTMWQFWYNHKIYLPVRTLFIDSHFVWFALLDHFMNSKLWLMRNMSNNVKDLCENAFFR